MGCTFTWVVCVFLIQNLVFKILYSVIYGGVLAILMIRLYINRFEIEYDM